MQRHATDDGVFIRSMASRGHLGGLALAAPQAVRAMDAFGYRWVLLETVGVGQVEVEVAGASDTTIVVVTPRWGDSVQANKAGLLEIGDIFCVNKADRDGVGETVRDLEQMLDLSAPSEWRPPVIKTVATTGQGVDELWAAALRHRAFQEGNGSIARRRRLRIASQIRRIVTETLRLRSDTVTHGESFESLLDEVEARRLDPYAAAEKILMRVGRQESGQ
jgi:GTPase